MSALQDPFRGLSPNLDRLRLHVLRGLFLTMCVAGVYSTWTNYALRPASLPISLSMLSLMATLAVLSFARPGWYRHLLSALAALLIAGEHAIASQAAVAQIQPGVVLYATGLMFFAFLGSGWQFLFVAVGYGSQFLRFPPPSDPTLAVIWGNALGAFVVTFVVSGLFWLGISRLEADHRAQKEELERSLEKKTTLVKMLFHDLANPLTVVSIAIEEARDCGDSALPLEYIDEPIKRLLGVAWAARELAAWERPTFDHQLKAEPLVPVIYGALRPYQQDFEAKSIRLVVNIVDGLVARTHAQTLQISVLGNLLSNAVKFAPPKSEVTILGTRSGEHIALSVENQGDPIADEVRERILSGQDVIAQQGSAGERGTGYGLQIARSFVELMAGRLRIENTPSGVRFTIELPSGR